MKQALAAFPIGLLFGAGLVISQMVNPAVVLGFLDITGAWNPSLAFVMGGALIISTIGYKLILRNPGPLLAKSFQLPTKQDIDPKLVIGAALFGIGWGLSGLCPGPAIVGITLAPQKIGVFILSMIAGILIYKFGDHLLSKSLSAGSQKTARAD